MDWQLAEFLAHGATQYSSVELYETAVSEGQEGLDMGSFIWFQ